MVQTCGSASVPRAWPFSRVAVSSLRCVFQIGLSWHETSNGHRHVLMTTVVVLCSPAFWGASVGTNYRPTVSAAESDKEQSPAKPATPTIKVLEGGESHLSASKCRKMIVGPGVNQPDPFPGYNGMVGWSCPVRLRDGTMYVTFSAGYWHGAPPTPLTPLYKQYLDSETRSNPTTERSSHVTAIGAVTRKHTSKRSPGAFQHQPNEGKQRTMTKHLPANRRDFFKTAVLLGAGQTLTGGGSNAQTKAEAPAGSTAKEVSPLKVAHQPVAQMLSTKVKSTLSRLMLRQTMTEAGCLITYADHDFRHEPALIARPTFHRRSVSRGSREHGNFQHHAQITKFHGRYYLAWSNGLRDEESPGQQILIADSEDGLTWSAPRTVVPRQTDKGFVHNAVGLLGTDDELCLFCWTEIAVRDADAPGMRRIEAASKRVDLYSSRDSRQWNLRTEKLLHPGHDHAAMFEAPRKTREGVYLCGGSQSGPVVFR